MYEFEKKKRKFREWQINGEKVEGAMSERQVGLGSAPIYIALAALFA